MRPNLEGDKIQSAAGLASVNNTFVKLLNSKDIAVAVDEFWEVVPCGACLFATAEPWQ